MPDSSPFDWNDDDDDNNNFEMADLGAPGLGEDDADNAAPDEDEDVLEVPQDGLGETLFEDDDILEVQPQFDHELFALPEVWRDGDGIDQDVITQRIRKKAAPEMEDLAAYEAMEVKPLKLSRLRQIYESKDERAALDLLKGKWQVQINKEFIVKRKSPEHQWASVSINLDYRFVLGNSVGIHAAMPNTTIPEVVNNPDWVFRFSTRSSYKAYRGSRRPFGFDVAGRMLMIGNTPANEEVFIVLADADAIQNPLPNEPVGISKRSTCMRPPLRRAVFAMLAYMMKRARYRSVSFPETGYPSLDNDNAFNGDTNIMEKDEWDMTIKDMMSVNDAMIAHYAKWLKKAPDAYKNLPEFKNSVPTAVVIRYGQNRELETGAFDTECATRDYWVRAVNPKFVCRIQIGLAQQIRYSPVDQWCPRPPRDILKSNKGHLYKTVEHKPEDLVEDLRSYPLLDGNGNRNRLFNARGQEISRYFAKYIGGEPRCCGLLQDLSNLDALFENDEVKSDKEVESNDEVDLNEDAGRINDADEAGVPKRRPTARYTSTRYDVYPHAFLSQYGQWQAHGIIAPLAKLLHPITKNTRLRKGVGPTVEPTSSQCYNTFAHRVRESARLHIAQRGLLTATVAGAWATSPKGNTTFRRLFVQANSTLPHLRLESQVNNVRETYLRFENVFHINCDRMRPEALTGEGFYRLVIKPIIDAYYQREVVDALRKRCLIVRPEVFPNLYLWTSYPIVTLLKAFWTFYAQPSLQARFDGLPLANANSVQHSAIQRLSQAPDHYVLEMIAILERLINFCHTGLAKALTHTLMRRLWPSRAILDGYFPSFWQGLQFSGGNSIRPILNLARWPLDAKTGKPLSASLRAQELTYGAAHVETYRAHFQIRCLLARTAPALPEEGSLLSILCGLVMDAFIADVTALVGQAIDEVKTTLRDNPSHPDARWMHTRCVKFRLWCATEQPLNYGEDHAILDLLTQAVSETLRDSGKSLPKSALGKCSVQDFVDRLYTIGMGNTQQSITAPVWVEGSTAYTLRLVLAEAHRQLGEDLPAKEREETIKYSLREAANNAEIHFFPDHAGDRTRRPSIKHWTYMGQSAAASRGGPGRGLSQEERISRDFYRHADELQREDVNAEWSIHEVTLGEYGQYITRERLPTEWSFRNADEITSNQFNNAVYTWAQKRFTQEPQHWHCRLALALAFLHTSALPKVHMTHGRNDSSKKFVTQFEKLTRDTAAESINIARKMPLHVKENQGGFKDRGNYLTMASTLYLGWIDPQSPIHKELKRSPKTTLPLEWTKKHATKAFTVPILLRFGVIEGWGSGVLYSPKKEHNYCARSQADLRKWEDKVTTLFKKGPDGAYQLAEMVLGPEDAQRLDEAGQFPGMLKRRTHSTAPRRPLPPASADRDDDDDDVVNQWIASSSKRRRTTDATGSKGFRSILFNGRSRKN